MTAPLQMPPSSIITPGMPSVPMPPGVARLAAPVSASALAAQEQGQTEAAIALLEQEIQQRQEQDAAARQKALKAIYGENFPLALARTPTEEDWVRWSDDRWETHRPGIQNNIWNAERNRQFRAGYQWITRLHGAGAYREQPIPKDAVRIVDNRIRPALAWIMQVVAEQRPGWSFKPTNNDADRERKAAAQQRAVEYQYDAQAMRRIVAEGLYWAQTDGVSFAMTYWDPDQGPWEELEQEKGPVPLGEPDTKVYRIEQVRVSSEATATQRPMYWLVRDILPLQQAVALYGPEVSENPDQQLLAQQMSQFTMTNQYAYSPLFQNQSTVARTTIFCEKSQWLPQGLTVIVCGKKVVYGPVPLLMGRVPMIRMTDGSEDPAFYPVPKMNLAIAPQMRVNMLWSKWYESIRKNSGGRFATKNNAVSAETLIGGETSMLEVRTSGDIRESILPITGFSVGGDIKEALDREINAIENLFGYTKEARGQFSSDQSGRAILAQREQLERVFAPQVGAVAEFMTEWAKQMVGWMRFGYQMPRMIAIQGHNRSDLAYALSAVDLDGIVDVAVDPETLVPQPKALRQWALDNAYDRQLITKQQWLERSQFGDVRDMQAPSEIDYQKAMRVAQQILLGQSPEPIVWQDDEAIHQTVLERDIIKCPVGDGAPGQVSVQAQQVAAERWQQLAAQQAKKSTPPTPPPPAPDSPEGQYQVFLQKITQQAVAKAEQIIAQAIEAADALTAPAGTPPSTGFSPLSSGGGVIAGPRPVTGPATPHAVTGKAPPKGRPMDPRIAPVSTSNPSVASAPVAMMGGPGVSDTERAANVFEATAPQ